MMSLSCVLLVKLQMSFNLLNLLQCPLISIKIVLAWLAWTMLRSREGGAVGKVLLSAMKSPN